MNTRSEKAPNIVLIISDQLRWDFVGAYGKQPFIKTPNIDRLAASGCRFDKAYSPNPVCIPARHNLITGLTARYHGFDDNYFGPESKPCPWYLPTFAQILSDCGYATAAIGKMHFQPERRATGFDIFKNCDEVVNDIGEDEYALFLREKGYGEIGSLHGVRNVLYMQPQQSVLPDELHGSSWVATESVNYIKTRKTRNRPFLLCTGFIHPHPPLDVPPDWAHLYDGAVPSPVKAVSPLSKLAEENKCIADLPDDESVNRMREAYASAVSFMDYNVGRILDALDEEHLRENTLVVFLSDHGEMLGDLGTYQKFLPYDASARIPLLMSWPGHIKEGTVNNDFCDLNDILPTLLDAAGASYPKSQFLPELPGESLLSGGRKDRTCQYLEHQRESKRWCCLIKNNLKYVHYYGDKDQLFDLEKDPDETLDIFDEMAIKAPDIVADLKVRLLKFEEKWGLEGYVENDDFKSFPPYEISTYRECCYPSQMTRDPEQCKAKPLGEEILDAIRNEKTVHLSKLHIKEMLLKNGFSEEDFANLLERAKKQGNY